MTIVAEPPVKSSPDAEPPNVVTESFPYGERSAGQARELVRITLRRWDLADMIENVVLVTSELMTNAIQTGCRRRIALTVERIGECAVRISIEDGSRYPPVLIKSGLPAGPDRVPAGGRGLVIVDALSSRWGLEARSLGKVVFAEFRLGRPRRR